MVSNHIACRVSHHFFGRWGSEWHEFTVFWLGTLTLLKHFGMIRESTWWQMKTYHQTWLKEQQMSSSKPIQNNIPRKTKKINMLISQTSEMVSLFKWPTEMCLLLHIPHLQRNPVPLAWWRGRSHAVLETGSRFSCKIHSFCLLVHWFRFILFIKYDQIWINHRIPGCAPLVMFVGLPTHETIVISSP